MSRNEPDPPQADSHFRSPAGSDSTTPPALANVEEEVLQRISRARTVFCFVDYDGTLAPIAPTPNEAVPPPGTASLLRQIAIAPRTHVAIVTGRPIVDVRQFLDLPELYYIGIHGLEIMLPNESVPTTQGIPMIRSILPTVKRELENTLQDCAGILIEDKGAALACHYRQASPSDAELARKTIAELTIRYQRRGIPIALQHGHAVAEIRPAHVNKGKAVCALLAARAPHALPVCIGDDRTDVDAFRLLPPRAITIHVAPHEPTPARYQVSSPMDVHRFLNGLLKARMRSSLRT